MYIKSLSVRNLLSFGPHGQELKDFKPFNLLIGTNGSGKSNLLKLIGGLKIEYKLVHAVASTGMRQGEPAQNALLSTAKIDEEFVTNRFEGHFFTPNSEHLISTTHCGDLRIEYVAPQMVWGSETVKDWLHVIEFKNGSLISGDPNSFYNNTRIQTVSSEWDDLAFANSLRGNGDMFQKNGLLIFGLRYVFNRDYVVGNGGSFIELHTRRDDGHRKANTTYGGFNKTHWAGGVLNVAKIIQQLTRKRGLELIALLEEPELGLEPRVIRRFINLLLWLGTPETEVQEASGEIIRVQAAWECYVKDIQSSRDKPVRMPSKARIQYFVTSHSPVVLSKVLELGECVKVFEFSTKWQDNSLVVAEAEAEGEGPGLTTFKRGDLFELESLWSTVRPINTNAYLTMTALGASGADVLQCNGIVWVEGPSDVIYLQAWLDMYARQSGMMPLIQGHHFEFQMYGGALLDSLCLQIEGDDPTPEQRKLVEMFSFSRNAYIVMDSDAVKNNEGEVLDKSNFRAAKEYIKQQVIRLRERGYGLGLWFAEGDCELRTIEDYLDFDSRNSVATSLPKRIAAERITSNWTAKSLSEFPQVEDEIKKMYEQIIKWQPG